MEEVLPSAAVDRFRRFQRVCIDVENLAGSLAWPAVQFDIFEGLDNGLDNGPPVDWTCKKVTVEVFPGK